MRRRARRRQRTTRWFCPNCDQRVHECEGMYPPDDAITIILHPCGCRFRHEPPLIPQGAIVR